ncbi:hypothetical protein H696_06295, partial [Fonticula alba]
TFPLAVDRVRLVLECLELRAAAGAVACGLLADDTHLLPVAGSGVRLHEAPVVVTLRPPGEQPPEPADAGAPPPARCYPLSAMHFPATSLGVLFAPAGGPVARALAAWRPDHPAGPFYAAGNERVFEIRVCRRPVVPGIALRAGRRLLASLGAGLQGRPLDLALCQAPTGLGVVWLDTDLPGCPPDRARMLAQLAGAPLRVGQVIDLASPKCSVRVVRLMSRQFADVPSGVAHTTGPEPTLLHVHAPRGPATGPRRLVALPPDRASPELVLLEPAPGAVGSPAGRLLVSPGAFRRLAGPAAGPGRGAVPFAAAGAQFDVCPDEGVPRFAILVPPADWPAFALPGGLPLRLDPAPGLPVAARVDIRLAGDPAAARALPCDETLKRAFLAAHAGATMRLDRPLTFACQGIALQAAIQRIAWAGSPDLARPAGLLPMDSHAAAQCLRFLAPGSPRPSPGRWLLVDRPHAGPGAEHGPCLEARPMPPGVAVAPGRAIVSPDTYQHLRGGLPGRGDVFLTWGDRALMIAPGPWPGGRLPAGQVALSPDSWDRLFDGQCFRRVGLSASLPRVALVEVHLAQGVPGLMFASHPGLVAAFVQMLDRSELDLPVQDTTLRARLVHLAGADLRPLGSGLLDMHHARAFIYMSAPGDDFPVLDRPASVLLRAPLLAGDLRLPVVFGRDPGRPDRKCVMVPAETLHALQAHCLEDDPALRVNRDYLVLPHDLAPHPPHILAARGVFPADGSAMVLSCTQLPEVLTATCQVATGGHAPGPEDAELLASLLPGALPRSGVIQTHQRYTVAPGPDRPTAELVATWLTDEAGAPCEAGVLVAGLTR